MSGSASTARAKALQIRRPGTPLRVLCALGAALLHDGDHDDDHDRGGREVGQRQRILDPARDRRDVLREAVKARQHGRLGDDMHAARQVDRAIAG